LTPTGDVVLKRNKKTIGEAMLKQGSAKIGFRFAMTGTVRLRAVYRGDGNFTRGRSVVKEVRITAV
jgi:hypothetical protein